MSALRIGVDLDNTIVCYDHLFRQLAIVKGLTPSDTPASKRWIRDHLRCCGREDAWTELQGEAYGAMMHQAEPFCGARSVLSECIRCNDHVFIVSHRTKHPFRGPEYDLHDAAFRWLEQHEFIGRDRLLRSQVFLELTREAKLQRIADLQCTHFIDDLPELLTSANFPSQTQRILFDPHDMNVAMPNVDRVSSWDAISHLLEDQ